MGKALFDLTARRNDGHEQEFSEYSGKVILVVNTASKCGFTPQYKGLEALYRKYRDRGLVVLGFPCDQFAHQEPGTDSEIAGFCELNFGVTFPLMAKVEVNGRDAHPVFDFLKQRAGGLFPVVKWNFTKFLVSRDGSTVKRFEPSVAPEDMEADIEHVLGGSAGQPATR